MFAFGAVHFQWHMPQRSICKARLLSQVGIIKLYSLIRRVTLVVVGYVNISVADISEHRLEERWYHVSSAVVGRSTRDSRNDSVSMRVKTQYQTVSILPLSHYDRLLQVTHNFCFVQNIAGCCTNFRFFLAYIDDGSGFVVN